MKRARIVSSMLAVMLGCMTIGAATTAGAATPREKGERVKIRYFAFHPNALELSAGEYVKVINIDGRVHGVPHSLTSKDGLFDTGVFVNGTRKIQAPSEPGVYKYICIVHPFMYGTFTVKA